MGSFCTIIGTVVAKPEKREELRAILDAQVTPTRAEPGCINYDFHVDMEDPCCFVFYENWRSREDLERHMQMPHLKPLLERQEDLLARPVQIRHLDMLSERSSNAPKATREHQSPAARHCPWDTTAKIIRAFLDTSTRLIKAYKGEIRSFDGDRVMGVFVGNTPRRNATKCAREIFYTVENILGPKATKKFKSISSNNIKLKCGIGVDYGTSRAVRAGIRNSNDLIWIDRPPNMAAKLSDIREYPYSVMIHKDVYNVLKDADKYESGTNIWESRTYTLSGVAHSIYRTKWTKYP